METANQWETKEVNGGFGGVGAPHAAVPTPPVRLAPGARYALGGGDRSVLTRI